ERLWPSAFQLFALVRSGALSAGAAVFIVLVAVAAITAVVGMTIAARRIPIQIPRKVMGRGRIREGQKTFIPIRLITAGVMPIVFAQSIIIVPGTCASFSGTQTLKHLAAYLSVTSPLYLITRAIL